MAVPAAVADAYARCAPAVAALARYVEATVRAWCDEHEYGYTQRRKTAASLSEKLETGRVSRWSDIDDLFACSIVVPTAAHEPAVREFLDDVFQCVAVRSRNTTAKPPDAFRFDATRYIATSGAAAAAVLPPGSANVRFEVQIPTVFEHAWGVVTHDLVYKADDADWRRARLAAQLKAAVEQIELIIAGFESTMDFVTTSSFPETDAKQRVVQCFKALRTDGVITAELVPDSWSRFGDNVFALVRSYSNRFQAPDRTVELCELVDANVRATGVATDIHGGSLFQLVVGLINAGIVPNGRLEDFTILESSELRDIHGVAHVPRPFIFD